MLIIVFSIIWVILFLMYRIYSYQWMFKDAIYRPLDYHRTSKSLLNCATISLICLTIIALIKRKFILAIVVIIVSVLTGYFVKLFTYKRAIKRWCMVFEKSGHSHEESFEMAKMTVDSKIQSGEYP